MRSLLMLSAVLLTAASAPVFAADADSLHHPFQDSIARVKERMTQRRRLADSLERRLLVERERLITQFELVVSSCPLVKFNDPIYIRLAELYYERAVARFEEALNRYEEDLERVDKGEISTEPEFPAYDFSEAIRTYDRIVAEYPNSPYVDDALYYKALCIEKQSGMALALGLYRALVEVHTQSEYRVEAMMKMAGYYFDHPRDPAGGFQKAAEIYKKVLAYRENRNFSEALYRLGWCYYMEDRYPEAISVFKYLIEEVEPDFDQAHADDRSNPLLRTEAVDFIAVSFFESNNLAGALEFLRLIGNRDYASLVLVRLGELYEEQQQYPAALDVYAALLGAYPLSAEAPVAQLARVRCHIRLKDEDSADSARIEFFGRFARGGQWQRANARSSQLAKLNDEAVQSLTAVADRQLARARAANARDLYAAAAGNYAKLIAVYNKSPGTYEAHWNMAVVLDQNLQDYPAALREYLRLCNDYLKQDKHRKEAAINAVAMAQNILASLPALAPDSLMRTGRLEPEARDLVSACANFLRLYPGDSEASRILFIAASTHYNRGLFKEAISFFQEIVKRTPQPKEFEASVQLIAQGFTGLGQHERAAEWYEKLIAVTASTEVRNEAFRRLVEARYRLAEAALTMGRFPEAALLFYEIAKRYPQSEYADVVLFSAAEAYEKLSQWRDASRMYDTLVTRYPKSKHAPGALFNAALDFERDSSFAAAGETYERLIRLYPQSPQMKDAFFNLALCYEKQGRLDRVAETHERYAALFPQAEDVERLLFESAKFYRRSNMNDRALKVFGRFSQGYPGNPLAVEALHVSGVILMDLGKRTEALARWEAAAALNARQKKAGAPGNDYWAAEAVFAMAAEYGRQYGDLRFTGTGEALRQSQKRKNDALLRAALKYEEAAQYRTVRIFEASLAIGRLYEDFALAFWKQDRPAAANPLKKIVFEKEIAEAVAQLILRAAGPYETVLKLVSVAGDSLPAEALGTAGKARNSLAEVFFRAGDFHAQSANLLENSPVPDVILRDPLQVALYKSKLLQTVAPIKEKALSAWLGGWRRLDSLKVDNDWSRKLADALAEMNFRQGHDFEKLAIEILTDAKKPVAEDQDEELAFQLEDVAYDLQDAALARYKVSLERAQQDGIQGRWTDQILDHLAIMDPDHYAARKHLALASVITDSSWRSAPGSAKPGEDWFKQGFNDSAWSVARSGQPKGKLPFLAGPPSPVWAEPNETTAYFRKSFMLRGQPISGEISVTADDNFRIYINGTYVACDDSSAEDWMQIKGYNVTELLRSGPNLIAAVAMDMDRKGFAFAAVLQARLDTTKAKTQELQAAAPAQAAAKDPSASGGQSVPASVPDAHISKTQSGAASGPKSRKEYDAALSELSIRQKRGERFLKREEVRIDNLKYQLRLYDSRIEAARKEIESLKSMLEGKRRKM